MRIPQREMQSLVPRGPITYLHLDPRGRNCAVLDEWNFDKRRA